MDELENIIKDLIERKDALPEDSPEHRFVVRQLVGLRYSPEEAGGIIEDLDPMGWGSYARPLKIKKANPANRAGSRLLLNSRCVSR